MTECIKCETCLYNKNCQFLAKHRNTIVEDCSAYKNAADMVEVVYGEWKFNKDGSGTCNQCGITQKNVWDYDSWQNYCGHCGADMRGKKK
jgi:hypothetical protein